MRWISLVLFAVLVAATLWVAGEPGAAAALGPLPSTPPPADGEPDGLEPPPIAPERSPGSATAPAPVVNAAEDPAAPSEAARTGRVTVHGRLVDADSGDALVGHRLDLVPALQRAPLMSEVRTDADGAFVVELDPGEYQVFHRAEAGAGERALARDLSPRRLEVGAGQDVDSLVIRARRPPAELEVEVTYADGRPASGAVVTFDCRADAPPLVDPGNRTDAAGRVRVGVWSPLEFTFGTLVATDGDGHVSEVLEVDAPLVPGIRRLVLQPGATLEVRVLDATSAPVPGRRILLASDRELGPRLYRETGEDGGQRFGGLFEGSYALMVGRPESGGWDVRGVELRRGEARELEVVLGEAEPRAVSGYVLDEKGAGLADVEVVVAVDDRPPKTARTNGGGAFQLAAPGGERVHVLANVVQQGDRYDPPRADVEFGATDVVLRRVERAAERTFEVEVVESTTGEEVERFVALLDRGAGTERWGDAYAGRRSFTLRLLEGARWSVRAPGCVTRELDLVRELDRLDAGQRLRVELDPGLDHALQVLDAKSSAPVPGVEFRSPTAGVARTDDQGRVRLRADRWSTYRVTKEGFEALAWDPDDEVLWGRGRLWLERDR